MPYIEINNANIYYEVYGDDSSTTGFDTPDERFDKLSTPHGLLNPPLRVDSDHAPIVLIHGSTNTGQTDWSDIAPELARRYKVFVEQS